MTACVVIGLLATPASGADSSMPAALTTAPVPSERGSFVGGNTVSGSQGLIEKLRSDSCPSAHKAVRFYSRRLNDWRGKMGAAVSRETRGSPGEASGCPRFLAHVLQRKSFRMRKAFGRWHAYQYDWQAWLPDKWQRIGACETGYGRRPGNWRHSNSSYEGAFGFAVGSWDAFTPYADRKAGPYPRNAYLATPRQQYEVALAIQRRYGLSGWGCRNS